MSFSNNKTSIKFIVGDITARGGIERVTINLANSLSYIYNVSIISLYKENNEPHFKINNDIDIIYIDNSYEESMYNRNKNIFSGLMFDIRYILNKRRKIKPYIFNNDIIISCDIKTTTLLYKIIRDSKIIAIEHFEYNTANTILQIIRRIIYKRINMVVSLTSEDKNKYIGWLKNKHTVIPNILQPPQRIEKFENKENIIIAVGRLNNQKGFDLLLQAWKDIPDTNWILKIIGDGEEKYNLLKYIEREKIKNVSILPYQRDIDSEYQKAKIFVLSSRYEGLGMVLLEALSHGLSCISFKCPAGPETILSKGNGILIENGNVKELGSQLFSLMNNPEKMEQLYRIGPLSIDEYSEKSVSEKWTELIESLKYE